MTRPKYHQSQIQAFLKCGKLYDYRYNQGIKSPPRAALTVGSSVDIATSANLTEKIKTKADKSLEEVLDIYSTAFDSRAQETTWGEDDPGQQKDLGAKLVSLHHTAVAPTLQPETVQEEFHLSTDAGYDLGGTFDVTDVNGLVRDTKTAKSAYDPDAISRALQPAMYDFAYESLRGRPAAGFQYDVLVKPTKTRPPVYQAVRAVVSPADRAWLFGTITNVHKAIQAGVALPAPEGAWWCSQDWCGYWSMCKGKK
jgi:hypothetical protein